MDQSSSSGFRSRRSYPSLNHVSLAPLTPRFPIDANDDTEVAGDYFSPRGEAPLDTPNRTSYLSSYSVPGSPGVLSHSHSRSASRVRHHARSKSSTPTHLSDSNLQDHNVDQPLHHHNNHNHKENERSSKRPPPTTTSDAEWMLRAGIALATSTREEKGQSWLVKRESSTSLVSDAKYDVDVPGGGGQGSSARSRLSRSGRSTPAAYSRRGSRSRATSRRNSRPDLAMTGLEMTSARPQPGFVARGSTDEEARSFVPDFVDERIRAEMRSIQCDREDGDVADDDYEEEEGGSVSSDEYWDSEAEIDERELQRLTRERGFGLGSWVDRMVEWTLFGVDDWPLTSTGALNQGPDGVGAMVGAAPVLLGHDDARSVPALSGHGGDDDDRSSTISDTNSEIQTLAEKPGEQGGWEDASWLLRVMKRALI